MAKKKSKRTSRRTTQASNSNPPPTSSRESLDGDLHGGLESNPTDGSGQTTGRMLMTVLDPSKNAVKAALKTMANMTGMSASSSRVMLSSDVRGAIDVGGETDANYVVLEDLGVVILNGTPDECAMASAATPQNQNVVVEAECWNEALGSESLETDLTFDDPMDSALSMEKPTEFSRDFLLGAQSVLNLLLKQTGGELVSEAMSGRQCLRDNSRHTWGLQATGVTNSNLSGRGVRVAVLDSGFDINHRDFAGRTVHRASFIPSGQPDNDENDRNGHGTHCIGTACGAQTPTVGPRYGVAHGADIYSGKVLRVGSSGGASGADGWILAGINWALANRCQIISMSLGARATSSQYPVMYEQAASRGLCAAR